MTRIYLSGPITGHEDYLAKFAHAEREVIDIFRGGDVEVINPARICASLPESTTWKEYMRICYKLLDMADTICMLPGWKESSGACIEYGYAYAKNLTLIKLAGAED